MQVVHAQQDLCVYRNSFSGDFYVCRIHCLIRCVYCTDSPQSNHRQDVRVHAFYLHKGGLHATSIITGLGADLK